MEARKKAVARIKIAPVKARTPAKRSNQLSDVTIEELRSTLETLPQEIYDQIFEAVFTAPPGTRDLTGGSNHNAYLQDFNLLRISRETRALYAKSYYGNQSCFYFKNHNSYMGWVHSTFRVRSWLKLLPEAHRALLQEVVMARPIDTFTGLGRRQEIVARDLWSRRYHVSQGILAVQGKLFVREYGGPLDANEWRPLKSLDQKWASDVFLKGIQYFLDPSDKGGLDSVEMATW